MSYWKGNLPKLPIILKYSAFDYLMYSEGTSLDPPWSDLELHLSGDEFLRFESVHDATQDRKSTTRAEYVAAASCCGQVLWIQNQLLEYRHVKRGWDTKIPQSSGPSVKVGDEAVHKELGNRMKRVATTASSLEADQDSGNINRTQPMATLNGSSPYGIGLGSGPRCQDTILGGVNAQTRHSLVLPVQVPAAEGAFINTSIQATQDEGLDLGIPTDSQQTPITTQLSSSRPQKKQSRRKQRKETKVRQDETHHDDSVPIPSNDPLLSEKAKDAQAKEIAALKKKVQKLERKKKSRTTGLQRLRKVGESSRVESSKDTEKLFDIDDLHDDKVIVDMAVGEKQEKSAKIDEREVSTSVEDSVAPTIPITTADEGVTAAKIDEITPTSAPTTVIDELTLAQTLIEIKAAKPKAVTTAATTTTTRPKARGVVVQEPSEFRTTTSSPQASQPSKTKDKGKAIMIEPEVPLKRKDQVALDEEMARNLEAQLQAELIEEEKMARKKEEEANIALIESWENTQAMMEADRLLAERLQTREQEELTDEEKAKLFMEFMERRRKHFAALRAQEKRNRPPTKAQKRNQMSVYLKHMGGYKHNQLKGRSYDEIQKLFDKEMKRVNSFVAMNSEAQEISGKKDESSSKKTEIAQDSSAKRAGDKLESDESKKQKTDENEEVEEDNEAELKMHMVIVKDDDIAVDAIPLATKPPVIVEYKIIKEGIIGHYQLIRADGSSKRYSSMIRML
ncbi:hypothetical protein Tco_0273578 [Tanacetum coccineum]